MKRALVLSVSICLALYETEAIACSPPPPTSIEFERNSTKLQADALPSMVPALRELRLYGPKCASFHVHAYADDESESSRRLADARANELKRALINVGAKSNLIKTFVRSTAGNRDVDLYHFGASGRVHCDPASKNSAYIGGANCQPQYTHCYVELEDGTICNYDNVPDPNPKRYSIEVR
jgi:hypothetical protein